MWKHGIIPNNKWMRYRPPNRTRIRFIHPDTGEEFLGTVLQTRMTKTMGWRYKMVYMVSPELIHESVTISPHDVIHVEFSVYDSTYALSNLENTLGYSAYPPGTLLEYRNGMKRGESPKQYYGAHTVEHGIVMGGESGSSRRMYIYNGTTQHRINLGYISKVYNVEKNEHIKLGPTRSAWNGVSSAWMRGY